MPQWLISVMSKLPGSLSPEGSSRSGLNAWSLGKVPWNLPEKAQGRGQVIWKHLQMAVGERGLLQELESDSPSALVEEVTY